MTTAWRVQPGDRDVNALLDPATWASRVWSRRAERACNGCNGTGLGAPGPDGYDEPCETCDGDGRIEDVRAGVSACREIEDVHRYFGARMGDDTATADLLAGTVLVEMDADMADDDDHDAAEGLSILVRPRRILSVRPFSAAEIPDELIGA